MNKTAVVYLLVSCLMLPAVGQEKEPEWMKPLRQRGWGQEDLRLLERDRVRISTETFKQIFDPYIRPEGPVFITSDSLLNAYHVLLEETLFRLERSRIETLVEILRFSWDRLDAVEKESVGDPVIIRNARRRATLLVGTALRLLDEELEAPAELAGEMDEAVKKVVEAAGTWRPAWMGPFDGGFLGIECTRFRPRGFYASTEPFQRYFRATAWLQAVPLRIDREEELLAAWMLGACFWENRFEEREKRERFFAFFRRFHEILGERDDWDVADVSRLLGDGPPDTRRLAEIRAALARKARKEGIPRINDLQRMPPEDPETVSLVSFRFLSAARTPEALLFQKTTDPRLPGGGGVPGGMEVVAFLGSPFAAKRVEETKGKERVESILDSVGLLEGETLHGTYLRCLRMLLNEPEKNAPAFCSEEPWKIKSVQTALAAWAQSRHAWVLQSKQNVQYLGMMSDVAGFVEPEPDFFRAMAELAESCKKELAVPEDFSSNEEDVRTGSKPLPEEQLERLRDALRGRSAKRKIVPLWALLAETSRTLERLARKQLSGEPFDAEEKRFIRGYGPRIAEVMFYGGNSYLSSKDDAPRIADVFTDSQNRALLVGTGRPRTLYILYPWKGTEVLCRGAIVPYYEFSSPARLTDEEWKTVLDSPEKPDLPAWVKPIVR